MALNAEKPQPGFGSVRKVVESARTWDEVRGRTVQLANNPAENLNRCP